MNDYSDCYYFGRTLKRCYKNAETNGMYSSSCNNILISLIRSGLQGRLANILWQLPLRNPSDLNTLYFQIEFEYEKVALKRAYLVFRAYFMPKPSPDSNYIKKPLILTLGYLKNNPKSCIVNSKLDMNYELPYSYITRNVHMRVG